jgi:Holliday junction DNA helicase RuvA
VIASLRGRLRRKLEDRIVVEAAGVGYEIFVPPVTQQELVNAKAAEGDAADEVALAIHYHATQNQPRPVLIGFTSELDREFFEKLITVKDVGPLVAAAQLISAALQRRPGVTTPEELFDEIYRGGVRP